MMGASTAAIREENRFIDEPFKKIFIPLGYNKNLVESLTLQHLETQLILEL
jgi:hypothetical protein